MSSARDMMEYLGFTDEDLDYNRRGELSPRQIERERKRVEDNDRIAHIMLVLGGFFVLTSPLAWAYAGSIGGLIIWLILAAFFGGLGALGLGSAPSIPYPVDKVRGVGSLSIYDDVELGKCYYLRVSGYDFEINQMAYHLLKEEHEYTVYFPKLSGRHTLLSLETTA